jgi:hypothetical protein
MSGRYGKYGDFKRRMKLRLLKKIQDPYQRIRRKIPPPDFKFIDKSKYRRDRQRDEELIEEELDDTEDSLTNS